MPHFNLIRIAFLICTLLGWTFAFSPSYRYSSTPSIGKSVQLLRAGEESDGEDDFFVKSTETMEKRDEENNNEKKGEKEEENSSKELLEAVVSVSAQIAKDLFFFLRRTAATALTASLPMDEQQELLARISEKKPKAKGDDDEEESSLMQRNSVSENIAAAAIAESQKGDQEKWEREKEQIYKQAEQAANERVQNELAIQQQRMELEKRKLIEEAEAAKQKLEDEKKALKEQQQEDKEKEATVKGEAEKELAAAKEKEQELAAMQQALRDKEQQALIDKEKIESLVQELQTERTPTEVDATKTPLEVDSAQKPRIHAGRYTAREYHALSDDEKEMVKELREKEAAPAIQKDGEADITVKTAAKTVELEVPKSTAATAGDVHPILGAVISDLGYKRIHLLSAGKLGTIPIWKKQRIYRHNRVKAMANDKWKTMHLGLPGVICLHEDKNGKLSILDGQHRVGMMMLLRDKQRKQQQQQEGADATSTNYIDFDRVLVEVYPEPSESVVDDNQHAQDLFVEINKAEPIKLVDMPGVASAKDRKLITEAVDKLYDQYPNMFSPSQRCRAPNVNVDNMRNSLFGSNVKKTHGLTTSKKMLDWILEQNELLAKKYESDEVAQSTVSPKAWKKASENRFYLGLESSWLYN